MFSILLSYCGFHSWATQFWSQMNHMTSSALSEPGSYRQIDNQSLARPLWREKNACFFSIRFFYIPSGCQRNQNVFTEYQKGIQSKVAVGLAGHRKTYTDVQRKNLTDSSFIVKQSKQLKKQQAKLLIKSFTAELTFRELVT